MGRYHLPGIAMGAGGTAAAMETADLALMDSSLLKVVTAQQLGARCLAKIKQNVLFSIVSKAVMIALTVGGLTTLWIAVLADVGCMLIVCLNGMRLLEKPTAAGQQRPEDECAQAATVAAGARPTAAVPTAAVTMAHRRTVMARRRRRWRQLTATVCPLSTMSCVLSSRGLVRRVTCVLLLRGIIAS